MNYDDWLVWQEHEYRGWNDPEFECPVCDRPVEKKANIVARLASKQICDKKNKKNLQTFFDNSKK